MSGPAGFELDADAIVDAAIEILREEGLDAVSMRRVSDRLGVSPVPLYSRVGNKDDLIGAMADRILAGFAPTPRRGERWEPYARRWAAALRGRLAESRDRRVIGPPTRAAYVDGSRPLVEVMRRDGLPADAAVQACRLLTWATVGFATVETGVRPPPARGRGGRPGGDPGGVTPEEVDALFGMHIGHVIEGIRRDLPEGSGP